MKLYPAILAIFVPACALTAQSIPVYPGDPLPGLSSANLQLFQSGRTEFVKEYQTASLPAPGGTPRASTVTCGGCHQFSIGDLGAAGPRGGWPVGMPLYGAGLIEGIPDEAILALQNRLEPLALGIRGRATAAVDSATGRLRVGRFGWKAQHATLLDASAENLSTFIGIPEAVSRNEAPDPITGLRTIDRLAAFSRFLAPVGRIAPNSIAAQGESLFVVVGCAVCHTRSIVTAPPGTLNPATINPFSDFLLHDIGTGGGAPTGEIRTAPLWGLRLRKFLMHDGSALTPADAISAHQGTATIVRQRFDALMGPERLALIEYLKTL